METPYGSVTFTVYGTPKPKRPAILTYHDVGLNCKDLHFPSHPFWEEAGGRVHMGRKGAMWHVKEKFSPNVTVA